MLLKLLQDIWTLKFSKLLCLYSPPVIVFCRSTEFLPKVEVYDFRYHSVDGPPVAKMGTSVLLRRSVASHSLLCALMRDRQILKASADGLSKLLDAYSVRVRRNATKTADIRGLMQLQEVRTFCSAEQLQNLEQLLDEQDKKRRKTAAAENEEAAEKDDEDGSSPN